MLTGTVLNPKEIPECGYFLIVLKHEGNMPFENDGLRGVVRHHASRGRAMPFENDG